MLLTLYLTIYSPEGSPRTFIKPKLGHFKPLFFSSSGNSCPTQSEIQLLPIVSKAIHAFCSVTKPCLPLCDLHGLCSLPGSSLSMEFCRQEYFEWVATSYPGDLPDARAKPESPLAVAILTTGASVGHLPLITCSKWHPSFPAIHVFLPDVVKNNGPLKMTAS